MANLRILYNNVASSAVVTTSTSAGSFVAANLLKESKGIVWRSTSTTAAITLNWTSAQTISCVVLPFNNLSSTATARVRLYTGVGGVTGPVYDSTTIPAIVGTFENWDLNLTGVNRYSFGKAGYTVVWVPSTTAVTKIIIDLVDTSNIEGYIEVSSVLTGAYWSPVRNTSFGIELGVTDLSENLRTQSGNLVTSIAPSFRTLTLSLEYMPTTDRDKLIQILRLNGKRSPIFISVFPEDTDAQKASMYQIYGKISNMAGIVHPIFSMYTSSINLEEL